MNSEPSISAVINTFNRANILPNALNSVAAQVPPVQEIIVVDDGSVDETHNIVASFAEASVIPTRLFHQPNLGLPASRNRGVMESRSKYVAFLDDDDVWVIDHIARLRQLVRLRSDALLYGGHFCRDEGSKEKPAAIPHKQFADYEPVPNETFFVRPKKALVRSFHIPSMSTAMVRRDVALQAPFEEELKLRGDILFAWRLGQLGDVIFDDRPHAIIGQTANSLASTSSSSAHDECLAIDLRRAFFAVRLFQKALDSSHAHGRKEQLRKEVGDAYFDYAFQLLRSGNRLQSLRFLGSSIAAKKSLETRQFKLLLRNLLQT